jgi:hypothetical protein
MEKTERYSMTLGIIVLTTVGILLLASQWVLVTTIHDWKEAGVKPGYTGDSKDGTLTTKTCPNCGTAMVYES